MDNFVVTQPHQHVVYSATLKGFDLNIDIEFEGGISTILIDCKIGSVVFFSDKIQRVLDFETAKLFYMGDDLIQDVIDLCSERLAELLKESAAEITRLQRLVDLRSGGCTWVG